MPTPASAPSPLLTYYTQAKEIIRQAIKQVFFWLMIAVILMASLQMVSLGKDGIPISGLPLIFWLVWGSILGLLWRRRHHLETLIQQNLSGKQRGIEIFLATVYLTSISIREALSPSDVIGNLFPIMAMAGLFSLAIGFNQWHHFQQELSLAGVGSIPYAWLSSLREQVRIWDAQNMTFWLHYFGLKVVRQGSIVALPGGAVDVNWGCSSVSPSITMLALVLVLLALFPTKRTKQILIIITSLLLVFAINGVRLILLALFVHWQDKAAFNYWHGETGAGIFSNIIVVVIGIWCYWQLQNQTTTSSVIAPQPAKETTKDQANQPPSQTNQ